MVPNGQLANSRPFCAQPRITRSMTAAIPLLRRRRAEEARSGRWRRSLSTVASVGDWEAAGAGSVACHDRRGLGSAFVARHAPLINMTTVPFAHPPSFLFL